MKITYILTKLESGGFVAYYPDMGMLRMTGETEEEAIKKFTSAARMHLTNHPGISSSLRTLDLG